MPIQNKPFVQLAIEQVDTVIHDPEGQYDPDLYDRYDTFEAARDAALTSIEVMLDEADYDGQDHLEELKKMQILLEAAATFADLQKKQGYRWFLKKMNPAKTVAA